MKGTIIAIVGASGSGKTTLAQYMQNNMGIPSLVSYTTRKMREGEENGREHWFVDESEMPNKNSMLAYALFGGCHYWTSIDQVPSSCPCTYIIDEDALLRMIDNFGMEYRIIKVYIKRKTLAGIDQERIDRDKNRTRLGDAYYDAVIKNNGSLSNFLKKGSETIFNLI